MNKQRLESLKAHLVRAKDFAPVFEEFFDLAEEADFLDVGHRVCDPVIEASLSAAARLLGGELKDLLLIHVPEHGFFHGGFQLGRRMGSVFVFQDAQMGLAAASDMVTGDTRFARFSISLSVPVDQAGK
jgi:hypothetical protein